jgi:predicted ATPase
MGKTRLALQVAEHFLSRHPTESDFPHGVYFVPLQPLSDTSQIVPQIAHSTGFQLQQTDKRPAKQQLFGFLAHKQMFLLIDNWEHLLDGATIISEILQSAPQIKILTTSREKLQLSGETVYTLRGMQFPTWETPEDSVEYDAVNLLLQAAKRVKPDWEVIADDLDFVARICRLTDGMPLALLLAAGWLDVYSLERITAEIQRNVDFLETELRDIPARQRSIRAVFEYSWKQLKPAEQAVFMKLSVFRDGCKPQAAEVVTNANARILQSLVNKALLIRDSRGRYDTHELLHQYAEEQLKAAGEANNAREAHKNYYATYIAEREADIKGIRQIEALNEVEADFGNARRAWEWAVEQQDHQALIGMIETLSVFGRIRSRQLEVDNLLRHTWEVSVSRKTPESDILKGYLIVHQSPYEIASDHLDNVLEIARQNQDVRLEAHVYRIKSIQFGADLNYTEAIGPCSRSIALYQEAGELFYLPEQVGRLGYSYGHLGDNRKYHECNLRAIEIARQTGNQAEIIQGLNLLGIYTIYNIGATAQGFAQMKEAVNLAEQIGNRWLTANIASNIGAISILTGDLAAARRYGQRALAIAMQLDLPDPLGSALRVLALEAAIVDENYPKAKALAQRSLSLIPTGRRGTREAAYLALALAGCGLDDLPLIRSALPHLLAFFLEWNNLVALLRALPAVAYLAYRDNRYERAVAWIALASETPSNTTAWMNKWPLLTRLCADLKVKLGEEDYTATWERGKMQDLRSAAQELVAEFGKDP